MLRARAAAAESSTHARARGQRLREAQLTLTSRGRCKQNPFVAGVPDLLALVEQMCGSFSI